MVLLADLAKERKISTKEGEEWAAKRGFYFVECSAYTGDNIEKVFEMIVHRIRYRSNVRTLVFT